jgi:hypothetical protein
MLSTVSLSLLFVVVSLAAGIPNVDADCGHHSSMIKNLRGVARTPTSAETTGTALAPALALAPAPAPAPAPARTPALAPAPAPCRHHLAAPSIRILQEEEEDDVPTLSPVIVEYWNIIGDGYGNPNRPPPDEDVPDTDQVEIVAAEDLPPLSSDATKTDIDASLTGTKTDSATGTKTDGENDINTDTDKENENDIENDIDNTKSKNASPKNDKKWVILVAVLTGAAFLIMCVLLVLVCRARRRNRLDDASKQVVNGVEGGGKGGEKRSIAVTPAVAAAAAKMAAYHETDCDPTETDPEFSEHPNIREIVTYSDKAGEISCI